MPNTKTSSTSNWTGVQAYGLAVICLLVGVAAGWLFRGSQSPAADAPTQAASAAAPAGMGADGNIQPTSQQMKKMADTTAAPQLEKLKSRSQQSGSPGQHWEHLLRRANPSARSITTSAL